MASHTKSLKDQKKKFGTSKHTPFSDEKTKQKKNLTLWLVETRGLYTGYAGLCVCANMAAVFSRALTCVHISFCTFRYLHFFPLESLFSAKSLAASSQLDSLATNRREQRGWRGSWRKLSVVINSPQRRFVCVCACVKVHRGSAEGGEGKRGVLVLVEERGGTARHESPVLLASSSSSSSLVTRVLLENLAAVLKPVCKWVGCTAAGLLSPEDGLDAADAVVGGI